MERAFWIERWEKQETGFHKDETNRFLQRFWRETNCASGEVLVPLCGKTRDMLWLKEQGHDVLGVELSEIAVEAFFRENGMTPSREKQGAFDAHNADGFTLLHGDFFNLTAEDVKNVKAVYDRAATIALPPEMREKYAAHMLKILPANTPILLVTFSYTPNNGSGPPFSVDAAEVERLYAHGAEIKSLTQEDAGADNPHILERRKAETLTESAFLLKVRTRKIRP